MARIQASEKNDGETAVIAVDGVVIGGINTTAPGVYSVRTEGRVPGIDGLSGRSPLEAWGQVVAKVQSGNVFHGDDPVQIGPDEGFGRA